MGLVVGNHIHDYTASEMKTPQSRNWGKQVYHKIIPALKGQLWECHEMNTKPLCSQLFICTHLQAIFT